MNGEPYDIRGAADYLESRNGHALLVYKDGALVFEEYYNGYESQHPHVTASGPKSFSGVLAVMAEEDGILDLDERVSDTLVEWQDDVRKSKITIGQLLSLSSGVAGGEKGSVSSGKDAVKWADAKAKPGESFSYGPVPFQCWGELLRRKLDASEETVEGYMNRRLLDPIGLNVSFWRKDEDGGIQMPSGAFLTAREWAKFGVFVLAGGRWNCRVLVSEEKLQDCFAGTTANPGYGLTFWPDRYRGVPDGLIMAAGKGKQKLYILPSENLLIVQFAAAKGFEESVFLGRFFQGSPASIAQLKGDRAEDDASAEREARRVGLRRSGRFRSMDTNGDR